MISIHYFASIRESLGCEKENIKLPQHVNKVDELINWLIKEHGGNWEATLNAANVMVAVNHEMANRDATIDVGDEVAFFPPVTGG